MRKYSEWIAAGMTIVALVSLAILANVAAERWRAQRAVEAVRGGISEIVWRLDIIEATLGAHIAATEADLLNRHVGSPESIGELRERLGRSDGDTIWFRFGGDGLPRGGIAWWGTERQFRERLRAASGESAGR